MNTNEPSDKRSLTDFFFETKQAEWKLLSFYQRFEQVVAVIVTMIISVVIVFALFSLIQEVLTRLILGGLLDHDTFTRIFGKIMAVLIAMEFKHSIIEVAGRKQSVIRVTTVILIAMLAIARKLIILDPDKTSPASLAALAASMLALGAVYWLLLRKPERGPI